MTNQVSSPAPATLPALPATAGASVVTANQIPRLVDYYSLSESELSTLQQAGNYKTLDLAMFTFAAGVFVSLTGTLLTVEVPTDGRGIVLWGGLFASAVFSVYFAIKARIAWEAADESILKIKREHRSS
jgi:hypothetical protein